MEAQAPGLCPLLWEAWVLFLPTRGVLGEGARLCSHVGSCRQRHQRSPS